MQREQIKKALSYGTLQAIVENTILKMPELKDADMSEVRTHIFNGLYRRAQQISHKSSITVR